jgi:hypothetical protein
MDEWMDETMGLRGSLRQHCVEPTFLLKVVCNSQAVASHSAMLLVTDVTD